MAGELNIRSVLSRETVPVMNVPQLVYSLLELRPAEVASQASLPLNLCLVLDRSGSMAGSKIENLRDATMLVLDMLQPQDYLSIIFFSSRFEVAFPSQQVGDQSHRTQMRTRISQLHADGGTNMAPAMEAGLIELRKQMPLPGSMASGPMGQVNRLVLLTDGITEKERRCLEQADMAAHVGVPITALGIGNDWNDKLMQQIAQRSNGDADFVSSPDRIRTHFAQTVQQMQAVALQRATLKVKPALNVEVRSVYRAHPLISKLTTTAEADRTLVAPLGEIEKGHGQTLVVEFVVPQRSAGTYRIAQVEVDYDAAQLGRTGEKAEADLLLTYSHDPQAAGAAPNTGVMNMVEKLSAFKLQTRALEELEAGNVPSATQKLKGALTHLLNQGDTELASTVQRELENLEKGRVMTSEGRKTIRFESGKTVRLGKTDS